MGSNWIRLLCALGFLSGGVARAETGCAESQQHVRGSTSTQCEESAGQLLDETRQGPCIHELKWRIQVTRELAECSRGFMNAQLAVRLSKLEKEDPSQFSVEVQLQQAYEQVVQEQCSLYDQCTDPAGAVIGNRCRDAFYSLRAHQAELINANALELRSHSAAPSGESPMRQRFAEGLCKLPATVWDGGKVPRPCVSMALRHTAMILGAFKPHPCPRVDCPANQRVLYDPSTDRQEKDSEEDATEEPEPGSGPPRLQVSAPLQFRRLLERLQEKPLEGVLDEASVGALPFLPSPAPGTRPLEELILDSHSREDDTASAHTATRTYTYHRQHLLLLPLLDEAWCKLGSWEFHRTCSGGEPRCPLEERLSFQWVHLLDGDQQTLRVITLQGSSLSTQGFYDLRDMRLVNLLPDVAGEPHIVPGPYPRDLRVSTQIGDTLSERLYRYRDGRYVRIADDSK